VVNIDGCRLSLQFGIGVQSNMCLVVHSSIDYSPSKHTLYSGRNICIYCCCCGSCLVWVKRWSTLLAVGWVCSLHRCTIRHVPG